MKRRAVPRATVDETTSDPKFQTLFRENNMMANLVFAVVLVISLVLVFLLFYIGMTPLKLPKKLEPIEGVAQCNYELIRAFSHWVEEENAKNTGNTPLVYTLGAGSLLGAMRSDPPGLLQWEHDVDIYSPALEVHLTLAATTLSTLLPNLFVCRPTRLQLASNRNAARSIPPDGAANGATRCGGRVMSKEMAPHRVAALASKYIIAEQPSVSLTS